MEHNVCLSSFRSRGTFIAVLFWSTPECFAFTIIVPRLQRHRYRWAILQAMAVDSFLLGRRGDPAVLLFPSRTCSEFIAFNPGQKSLGQYCNIFLLCLGSLLKQCSVFEIFLQFSLPPPYTKLKLGKKILDTGVQHVIFCRRTLHLCNRYPFRLLVKSVSAVSGQEIMVVKLLLYFFCVCFAVCFFFFGGFDLFLFCFVLFFVFCFVWLFVCCCFCFLFLLKYSLLLID